MKWVLIILGLAMVAAIIANVYMRSVVHDPARWHIDPASVSVDDIQSRNQFLATHTYAVSPSELSIAVEEALGGELLAGDLSQGWATYVIRTRLIGFPDYVSVRVSGTSTRSSVTLFSRSRFGYSDLGANRSRIERVFNVMKSLPAAFGSAF